ncbi:MAG TPA: glycogen/starch synthase [Polyangiaceae bacterium]|nr:glycogen/starch synthase [Polyangiaceae bacterium]
MDVLMVAAELAPYARVTAAADSIAALAKALRQLGHGVTVALPRSSGFQSNGPLLARRLTPLSVEPGLDVTVLEGQLPSGVSLVLFDAPEFAADELTSESGGERVALLSRAAHALVRERKEQGKRVDVVHLHDFAAAPAAALLAQAPELAPSLLTIHSFGPERTFDPASLARLGQVVDEPRARIGKRVSPLRLGMVNAKVVTTVSPGYATELGDTALGSLIQALPEPLAGVLDGVDYATYSPATDAAIESRFDAEDLSNKGRCKTALVRATGLRLDPERPLLVALLGLSDPTGHDLLVRALPRLLNLPLAVVVFGAADAERSAQLSALQQQYPGDLGLLLRSDDPELRRCLSAADFTLSARSHSPAAHQELFAMRYGALPIACARGAVKDVVVDIDAELETGTGFSFGELSEDELVGAVQRAVSAFGSPRFGQVRRRAMRRDLGWDRPARRYLQIYKKLAGG